MILAVLYKGNVETHDQPQLQRWFKIIRGTSLFVMKKLLCEITATLMLAVLYNKHIENVKFTPADNTHCRSVL